MTTHPSQHFKSGFAHCLALMFAQSLIDDDQARDLLQAADLDAADLLAIAADSDAEVMRLYLP